MILSSTLLGGLFIPAVFAVPSGVGTDYDSLPHKLLETTLSDSQQSAKWAGAAWNQARGTFLNTLVTGAFVVPEASGPIGASAAAWVGIDGFTCQSAILQVGVTLTVESNQTSYKAWYEWFPDPPNDIAGITISTGNTIKLSVIASSTTSGTVTIENQSTGQIISKDVASSSHPLCAQNAEWIVEDYNFGGHQVLMADFGRVTFMNAMATGPGSESYTPSGAVILDIYHNGLRTTSTTTSDSSVTIDDL